MDAKAAREKSDRKLPDSSTTLRDSAVAACVDEINEAATDTRTRCRVAASKHRAVSEPDLLAVRQRLLLLGYECGILPDKGFEIRW